MIRMTERGTVEPSPGERLATSCGAPSSVTMKSLLLSPGTPRPFLSNARISKTASDVSTLMTVSESDRSSPLLVSTALCSRSSHLSLFRLEPNSSRFCFSCAQGAGETKEEASAKHSAITAPQRIDLYRKSDFPLRPTFKVPTSVGGVHGPSPAD